MSDLAQYRAMVVMSWHTWRASPQDDWRTWLQRHDLDPERIPIGATISVTEPDHQIEVSHYVRPGDHPGYGDPRVVQCEATVMPLPQIGGVQRFASYGGPLGPRPGQTLGREGEA